MNNVLQEDFPACMKSAFKSSLCVIQYRDLNWSFWPLRRTLLLWSYRASLDEHLSLSFWSCSNLYTSETSSGPQLSAWNHYWFAGQKFWTEFLFVQSNIKNKKKKTLIHPLNWKISYFSLSDWKYLEGGSFQLGNRVTSDDCVYVPSKTSITSDGSF